MSSFADIQSEGSPNEKRGENNITNEPQPVPEVTEESTRVVPKCSVCETFYGHTEGKCSHCFAGTVPGSKIIPKIEMSELDIAMWIETGVHSTCTEEQCLVCHETTTLQSNFCCECRPTTCADCNSKVTKCVYCMSGKYIHMTHQHIRTLLSNNFDSKSILQVVRNLITEDIITELPFTFERLVCHAAEIDTVVRELNLDATYETAQGNCEILNTIYCFAPDFWNTTNAGKSFVLCYKNFGMEDISKTYVNIRQNKGMCDKFRILETAVSSG